MNIVAVADIIIRAVDALSSFVSNVTSMPGGEVGHTSSWVVVNRNPK
ncbi:hypothetical protein HUO13_06105 [Saccharopolyspora erythraea]|nr:hypothetical protein [Saccharopolyspora erythraea]QUH00450.1 hypothetical protein HUO13_06105 [Saccharopolyspora erythraea]